MSLPRRYDRRMKQSWGLRAVWLPGTVVRPGDVVQNDEMGIFAKVGNLKTDFGIPFTTTRSESLRTGFKSAATTIRFFKGNNQIGIDKVKAEAQVEAEISFEADDTFMVVTPIGTVETLDGLVAIGDRVGDLPSWRHGKFFIVREVLSARGFTVLGSEKKNRKARFSGSGKAIVKFITLGASADVKKSSSSELDVEFIGSQGPLGMDLARVKKNGFVVVQ